MRLVTLLLIAVIPLSAAACLAMAPAPPLDSMRVVVKRGYEIYAASDDELRRAMQQIGYAEEQFGRYMGDSPPKLAVVVFDSPDRVAGYDFSPLRKRGLPVLRWVPSSHRGGDGGAVPAPPGAAPPTDERSSLSYEAGLAFFEAFEDTKGAGRAGNAGGRAEAPRAAGDTSRSNPAANAAGRIPVPDWFAEAVAALCEPPVLQNDRLGYMRDRIDRRIPLAELFTMKRPAAAPRKRQGAAAERGAVFRAEALSLARFIAEMEGDRYVGHVGKALLEGKTIGDGLRDAHVVLSKPEALERQWVEWVTQKR